jgi:hypothetical protein
MRSSYIRATRSVSQEVRSEPRGQYPKMVDTSELRGTVIIPRGLVTEKPRGQYPKRSGYIRATRSVSQEGWIHQSCEINIPRVLVTEEPRGQYPKRSEYIRATRSVCQEVRLHIWPTMSVFQELVLHRGSHISSPC